MIISNIFRQYFFFKSISRIPHFQMIRTVESGLLSSFINKESTPLLDLGCGNGEFAESLRLNQIYGIDVDLKAILEIEINKLYQRVILANASRLPCKNEAFASVFSNCAIEHMDHIEDVLDEIRRILKRKGEFIFTAPTDFFLKIVGEDRFLNDIYSDTRDTLNEYNRIHNHVNIFSLEKWKRILKKTGFEIQKHRYYLPGSIGKFIARMDVLYTVKPNEQVKYIRYFEKKFNSLLGLPLRLYFLLYLISLHRNYIGTHIIIKAMKN